MNKKVLGLGGRILTRFAGLFGLLFCFAQIPLQAQANDPSMVVKWNASSDPAAIGYNLYYGVASGVYTNTIDVGSSTNATVTGLVAGVTYYFSATAYDNTGDESIPSNEAAATTVAGSPNQPPTLYPFSDLTINQNAGTQTISLSGITSGAANENQTLTVTASSGNLALIPAPTVTYSSPNATGTLTFTPVLNAYGSATITVAVNDGGTSNNIVTRNFLVTVSPVNQAPTISAIPDQNTLSGTSTSPLAFTVGDVETPAGNLILSASSSNPALLPANKISFGGSNANRTVALAPLAGQSGNATVTITVSDGSATTSTSFQLVAKPRVLPPSNLTLVAK